MVKGHPTNIQVISEDFTDEELESILKCVDAHLKRKYENKVADYTAKIYVFLSDIEWEA